MQSQFWVSVMECDVLASLFENFQKISILSTKELISFLDMFFFFYEDITLLCLQIVKLEELHCKGFFVAASASLCYVMQGILNVKNVVVKTTINVCIPSSIKSPGFSSQIEDILHKSGVCFSTDINHC